MIGGRAASGPAKSRGDGDSGSADLRRGGTVAGDGIEDEAEMPRDRSALERIVRGVRQRLEIDRMFGWTPPVRWAEPEGVSRSDPPPRGQDASRPARDPRTPARTPEPERELAALRIEVAECTRCPLCSTRTQTVFGVGAPAARLMFVGEGPGADEDRQGEPFVGAAGQLLDRMIGAMGLAREDVYIANIVKCRPPGNRTPEPDEIDHCSRFLAAQVELVDPEVIVALGRTAAQALLASGESLGRLRGRFHRALGREVLPTFHPAYLLRTPRDKRLAWEDLKLVMGRLGLHAG